MNLTESDLEFNDKNIGEHYFEATVVTGFEQTASGEINEKLSPKWIESRLGGVYFRTTCSLHQILSLRSVDNVSVLIYKGTFCAKPEDKEHFENQLKHLLDYSNWKTGLTVWLNSTEKFEGKTVDNILNADASEKPSFRITCNRSGDGHCFTSMEAASMFGAIVNDSFKWPVSMKGFDIEVLLTIRDNTVTLALALTQQSLHYRNLIAFGPTSLRSTICYNLIRLANPQVGDIVCDPMCGSGAIPVESSLNWPASFHLAGDHHDKAIENTLANVLHNAPLSLCGKVNILSLDTTRMPFRTESVDVFVSDLPFGVRMGSKRVNKFLYPKILNEMARCTKLGSGRAVLLTQDKKSFSDALTSKDIKKFWYRSKSLFVKVGGLSATAYYLTRTKFKFVD